MAHYFITGTDTEVGKTYAACTLLHALRAQGQPAIAMKPIAAGTDAAGRNDDIERLRAAASFAVPRETMTPYLLAPAIAPHLAAAEAGTPIRLAVIKQAFETLRAQCDAVIVEGAGGFLVPLDDTEPILDGGDLALALGLPVILVVGLRLGCLNHALLSVEAIQRRGLVLAGWIGNAIDPQMSRRDENIACLRKRIKAPCLGILAHDPEQNPAHASAQLQMDLLND